MSVFIFLRDCSCQGDEAEVPTLTSRALWREPAAPAACSLAQSQPGDCTCFAGLCGQGGTGSDSEGSCDAVMWLRAEWCTAHKESKAARASSGNAVRWISLYSLCQFKQWLTKLLVIKSPNISSKQEENKTETNHSRRTLILNVITTAFTRQQIYAGITFPHCQGITHMQVLTHATLVR